jgi:hypothetical protein
MDYLRCGVLINLMLTSLLAKKFNAKNSFPIIGALENIATKLS